MKNVYEVVGATAAARCVQGLLAVWLLTMSAFGSPTYAQTAIPVAVVPCATCGTAVDLQSAARAYSNQWIYKTPPGYVGIVQDAGACTSPMPNSATTVLVVSTEIAISGAYYPCWRYPHGVGVLEMIALTGGSNADAVSADNLLLARSAKVASIHLPSTLVVTSTPELISQWLSSSAGVPEVPGSQVLASPWHALSDYPQVVEATFVDTTTGQTFNLWNGDVITVTDARGWTAKFQWTPLSSIQWTLVVGSIRDAKGHPVPNAATNQPTPGGVGQPGGPIDVSLPPDWNPNNFWIMPDFNNPTPGGTVTVGPVSSLNPDGYIACPNLTCS